MQIIHIGLNDIERIDNLSVCLGYFDSFHKGHLKLIEEMKNTSLKTGLITLEPNPKKFFTNNNVPFINSFEDKCEMLKELNVDYFIVLKVNKELLDLSAEDFINKIIVPLGVEKIVCGFDYTFGKNKLGNIELLKRLSLDNNLELKIIDEVVNFKNEKISTTLINKLISEGNIEEANSYLFKDYKIKGIVGKGNKLGTSFGFATANVEINEDYLLPKRGVYAGRVKVNNLYYPAMINIGTHPTVKESEKTLIEAHIIDFNENIYSKEISVTFDSYLRDEKKFESINDLISQLKFDENRVKELYKEFKTK